MRRLRALATAAAALMILTALAACSDDGGDPAAVTTVAPPAPTKSELVIGNVGIYSGPFGPRYQAGADALVAWSKWANAHGGVNGHPVRVIVRNDDGDAAKSAAAVRQMVEQDHIIALVGNNAGATDSAWRDYVEGNGIPVIGGLTLTQSYGTSPLFFPATSNQEGFVAGQVAAAGRGGHRVGVVSCAERASCQQAIPLFVAALPAAGLTYAGAQTVVASSASYGPYCRALKEAGADVLVVNTVGSVIEHFIDDCAKADYRPSYVLPGDVFQPSLISSETEGAYIVSGGPLWFGDQPAHRDFMAALKQYTKVEPSGFATRSWQAGLLFAAAARTVSDHPTPGEILEGLYSLSKETLGGWSVPLTYARGSGNTIGKCDWIAQIKNGKLTAPFGFDPQCM